MSAFGVEDVGKMVQNPRSNIAKVQRNLLSEHVLPLQTEPQQDMIWQNCRTTRLSVSAPSSLQWLSLDISAWRLCIFILAVSSSMPKPLAAANKRPSPLFGVRDTRWICNHQQILVRRRERNGKRQDMITLGFFRVALRFTLSSNNWRVSHSAHIQDRGLKPCRLILHMLSLRCRRNKSDFT